MNDPCESIVYLKHNVLTNEKTIKQTKNYLGVIKIRFKIDNIDENSFQFSRGDIKCAK